MCPGGIIMRKDFGAKAMLYPMPVLMISTYDESGNPDIMNAAWGGIADDTQINICLSPTHKTVKNIQAGSDFTVSMATAATIIPCDFAGIVSSNDDPEKIKKSGFHFTKSKLVNAPLCDELPMALECKVISYDEKSCRLLGEIVNVCADESVLGDDGKIDVKKLDPVTYDSMHHKYIRLGDVVADAFKCGLQLK